MLKTFEGLKKKLKPKQIIIDNLVFKLHCTVTVLFLVIGCILVSSKQYIGEHIHCIHDKGVETKVMNTFCFFTTTFTVVRHLNTTMVDIGAIPHPGVGNYIDSTDEKIQHAYYQWVPYVLFGQAVMFYIPHYIWKRQEGGRIGKLVERLKYAQFAFVDKEIALSTGTVPARSKRDKELQELKQIFINRLHINKSWSVWFVSCEILNAINLFLQVYLTNLFLGGAFYSLGPRVIEDKEDDSTFILDIVFPKVTKCTFHKYGPSGTIQAHDAMCVMALNIINEKIYTFLWFWYMFLGVVTILGLAWRVLTIFMHSRSHSFNRIVFSNSCPGKLNPWHVLNVTKEFHFGDWLFLYYLSKNMDGFVFMKLFVGMAESMTTLPLIGYETDTKEHENEKDV